MVGCDKCDRWYHGSCMKIDKETGDALSKWICPPCLKGQVAKVKENNIMVPTEDTKLPPAQDIITPPLIQPHNDISPHAPNPTSLWPPFGLRSSKAAVDVLGKVGDSDNEDFQTPMQPVARAKPGPYTLAQNNAQQVASTATVAASTSSRVPILCQPIASAKPSQPQPSFHQDNNPRATVSANNLTAINDPVMCQPIAGLKSGPSRYTQTYAQARPTASLTAINASKMPAYQNTTTGVPNRLHPNQQVSSANMPQAQISTSSNPLLTQHYNPRMQNNINTSVLNGPNLSAAVANLDAFVLGTGGNHTSSTSLPTGASMQMNVQNAASANTTSNGSAYGAGSMSQVNRKAP